MSLIKIVSGGQTGVDRGALDAALAAGLFGISASPLALLGAAPSGVRQRFALSSPAVICHRDVATDEVRKANRSRASGSPVAGERRDA